MRGPAALFVAPSSALSINGSVGRPRVRALSSARRGMAPVAAEQLARAIQLEPADPRLWQLKLKADLKARLFGRCYTDLAALDHQLSAATVVVPGHGAPVDRAFVRAQHGLLTELDWLIRDGHADGAPQRAVAARSPFGAESSLVAVHRGYAELSGRV